MDSVLAFLMNTNLLFQSYRDQQYLISFSITNSFILNTTVITNVKNVLCFQSLSLVVVTVIWNEDKYLIHRKIDSEY